MSNLEIAIQSLLQGENLNSLLEALLLDSNDMRITLTADLGRIETQLAKAASLFIKANEMRAAGEEDERGRKYLEHSHEFDERSLTKLKLQVSTINPNTIKADLIKDLKDEVKRLEFLAHSRGQELYNDDSKLDIKLAYFAAEDAFQDTDEMIDDLKDTYRRWHEMHLNKQEIIDASRQFIKGLDKVVNKADRQALHTAIEVSEGRMAILSPRDIIERLERAWDYLKHVSPNMITYMDFNMAFHRRKVKGGLLANRVVTSYMYKISKWKNMHNIPGWNDMVEAAGKLDRLVNSSF